MPPGYLAADGEPLSACSSHLLHKYQSFTASRANSKLDGQRLELGHRLERPIPTRQISDSLFALSSMSTWSDPC